MIRKEITKSKANEYSRANKKKKGKMLDEICDLTGWCRDHARKEFKNAMRSQYRSKRSKYRSSKYSKSSKIILTNAWLLSGCACGQYFVEQVKSGLLERLINCKSLKRNVKNKGTYVNLDDSEIDEIKSMSSATVDRYLSNFKKNLEPLSKGTTKPTKCSLRNEIPFGKSTHNSKTIGYLSTDTVAHCGESLKGDHIWTLNSTDTACGWTETISVASRSASNIKAGHEEILPRFPFEIIGVNYDGGSEFINRTMIDYAAMQNYIMTRSRPYHSNDNCHVEEKNNSVVRKYAFRYRYNGDEALKVLNDLWEAVNFRKNYLLPTKKCIGHTKTKSGRTRGIYDKPKSPAQRILESDVLTPEKRNEIEETLANANDAYVTNRILNLQDKLLTLAKDGTLLKYVEEVQEFLNAA